MYFIEQFSNITLIMKEVENNDSSCPESLRFEKESILLQKAYEKVRERMGLDESYEDIGNLYITSNLS